MQIPYFHNLHLDYFENFLSDKRDRKISKVSKEEWIHRELPREKQTYIKLELSLQNDLLYIL